MVLDARLQSSGAERAANVQIETGAKAEPAKTADGDGAGGGGAEHEDVSAGRRREHGPILHQWAVALPAIVGVPLRAALRS